MHDPKPTATRIEPKALLTSFEFDAVKPSGWRFSRYEFKPINLVVGATGSGKTRFLNALFNVGRYVARDATTSAAKWITEFSRGGESFRWEFESASEDRRAPVVRQEVLSSVSESGEKATLVERDQDSFVFRGNKLPKLSPTSSSLYLLRDEPEIAPIYYVFSHMMRRSFPESSIKEMIAYISLMPEIRNTLRKSKTLETLFGLDLPINAKLLLLREFFRESYDEIIAGYRAVFPNIEQCDIVDATEVIANLPFTGEVPVFVIKERHVSRKIPITELSSGMQKVLLLMTDIVSLPAGATYLIDEYENSLGVNAIDFLPSLLAEHSENNRFVITTHHPYLVNNIPVRNWAVFHRKGSNVTIKSGDEYEQKFKKSKQQSFIQLINDQFYSEGVE